MENIKEKEFDFVLGYTDEFDFIMDIPDPDVDHEREISDVIVEDKELLQDEVIVDNSKRNKRKENGKFAARIAATVAIITAINMAGANFLYYFNRKDDAIVQTNEAFGGVRLTATGWAFPYDRPTDEDYEKTYERLLEEDKENGINPYNFIYYAIKENVAELKK